MPPAMPNLLGGMPPPPLPPPIAVNGSSGKCNSQSSSNASTNGSAKPKPLPLPASDFYVKNSERSLITYVVDLWFLSFTFSLLHSSPS